MELYCTMRSAPGCSNPVRSFTGSLPARSRVEILCRSWLSEIEDTKEYFVLKKFTKIKTSLKS